MFFSNSAADSQNSALPNVIPNPTSVPPQDSIIADLLTLDLSAPASGKTFLINF